MNNINILIDPPSEVGTTEIDISKNIGEAAKIVARRLGISHNLLRKGLEIVEAIKERSDTNSIATALSSNTYAYIDKLWNEAKKGKVTIAHIYSELRRIREFERLKEQYSNNIHINNSTSSIGTNDNDSNKSTASSSDNDEGNQRSANVILADPPWQYEFGLRGNAEQHYPCLTLEEIANVFIQEHRRGRISHNCILFLWATTPKLREALQLLDILGFEYKTNMVWVKDKIGIGYYVRSKHELLLIAVRGNMSIPLESNRPDSVIVAERREHSRKPTIVYEIIERMYPNCTYLELFARERREGWKVYGLDIKD